MKHKGHKRFIPGRPLWSSSRSGNYMIWCVTCKTYFEDKWFYLGQLIKFEFKNLDNRYYRLMKWLGIMKTKDYQLKYFWQK